MNRWITVLGVVLLTAAPVGSTFAQQVPGIGFSALLCQLGVSGSGTYTAGNGELVVTVDDAGVVDGVGTAYVTVQHGNAESSHTVTYEDTNEDGIVDCGDVVRSVI